MAAIDEHDFVVLGDKDVEDFNIAGLLPQTAEELEKIQRWLQPTDFAGESSEFKKHLTSYVSGTGNWIQETEQFQQWNKSSNGILWIKAVPGAGKSVVAAHLAAQLAQEEKVPVLHFFFRQIITTNKTPQSLVRDWMSQILAYSPVLQSQLKDLLSKNRSLESVSFDELWEIQCAALCALPRVYCIVDALDEMDMGHEMFMRQLIQLGSQSSVKVLVTSRPLPRIENILNEPPSILQISLRLPLMDHDIATYVQSRLQSTYLPQETKVAIQKAIQSKSEGLFLYARLMMDDLFDSGKLQIDRITKALSKLPTGLGEMYTTMLNDHSIRSGVPKELQVLILQCVTHSSRPLRLLEIASIVDFVRKTTMPDLIVHANSVPLNTKSIIRAGCGPLLEILEDETVSIIHHSFTEFLVDYQGCADSTDRFPRIDFASTHRLLAVICINYLHCDWFKDWNMSNNGQPNSSAGLVRMKYPYLDYAINNFHYHVSEYNRNDEEISLKLDILLEPKSKQFLSGIDLMGFDSRPGKISPLHVAASTGLDHYTAHLAAIGHDVNATDGEMRTPLHLAAEFGYHKVAKVLLQNGARSDPDDYSGLKPLHLAASKNHSTCVEVLLDAGVDPFTPKSKEDPGNWCGNAARTYGDTPVEYACSYGHTESVRAFIPFLDSNGLSSALSWAAISRRTEAVLAILESPIVDINKSVNGKTPIYLAAYVHDLRSMRRLMDLKADVNIKSNNIFSERGIQVVGPGHKMEFSPLHAYASGCQSGLANSLPETLNGFQILLDAGCDINDFDGWGETPFQTAIRTRGASCKNGCPISIREFLVEHGSDPSAPTKSGALPLHLINEDASDIIEFLVAHGADVNAPRPIDGRTPLFEAVVSCSSTNFMTLLKHGADVNTHDNEGDTPLHLAITRSASSVSKIKTLLSYGADPNSQNAKGETPLHLRQYCMRSRDALSLLLKAKANMEVKTDAGLTVLLQAVKNRRDLEEVKALVEAGARVDARDVDGRTVLHHGCEQKLSAQLLRTLVEAGANPTATDFAGNSILHQVARQQGSHQKDQVAHLETVLDLGVSASSRNNLGQTAFHIAVGMQDQMSMMKMLKTETDTFDFLLGPKCQLNVNESDYRGIRPIHLACTLSEALFFRLVKNGADALAVTSEGQSILQIACRARQANIVGSILDLYRDLEQTKLIGHIDKLGRTALHYAVKSGRLESVKLLLKAGADVNLKDNQNRTPLDMCLEFKKENLFWTNRVSSQPGYMDAAYVSLDDLRRPPDGIFHNIYTCGSDLSSDNQTVGIREIVRTLVAYGADITSLTCKDLRNSNFGSSNLLECAIQSDFEVLVDELLKLVESRPIVDSTVEEFERNLYEPRDQFRAAYVRLRAKSSSTLLEGIVKAGESNIPLFQYLLRIENEVGIEVIHRLGADLIKPDWNGESCLTSLARWGYASLLEKVGSQASLIRFRETEKTDINLTGRLRPILHIACGRGLPNLDVIRILVEKLAVNINSQSKNDGGGTALHLLAQSQFWWQAYAMEYLIEKGADVEVKDDSGCTPLHIAVSFNKKRTVEILLANGANPNIIDLDNRSCLNKAGPNPEIAHLLIRNRADISAGKQPFIFTAIEYMDLATVDLLIEMEADCNARPIADKLESPEDADIHDLFAIQRYMCASMADVSEASYPIHFAAQRKFNAPKLREKMIPIIKSLLRGGADPLLPYNAEGTPVLHELCETEGIIQPLLDAPNVNLEARDLRGRTPLLAACVPRCGWFVRDQGWMYHSSSPAELLFAKGVDVNVVDNDGKNVLHHLLQTNDAGQDNRINTSPIFKLFLSQPQGAMLAVQKDKAGSTPLHYALKNKALWAIDMLLAEGADPKDVDRDGNSALHHVCAQFSSASDDISGNKPLVFKHFDKFLSLGLDINARNSLGQTPIFSYFSYNSSYLDNLPVLLGNGADLMVKDNKGQSLLHVVAKKHSAQAWERSRFGDDGNQDLEVEILKWLMDRGLRMEEDSEQRTPLDIAAANGNTGILELFKRLR